MRRFVVLVVLAVLGLPVGTSAATLGEQRVLLILTTWGPEPYAPTSIRAELDDRHVIPNRREPPRHDG